MIGVFWPSRGPGLPTRRRRGRRLVGAGLIVGVVAALSLGRLIGARLYGVSATDPWTIAAAMLLLAAVAAVAAFIPARQAATVDPSTALRCD